MEGLVFTVYKALRKKKASKQSENSSDEDTRSNNKNNNRNDNDTINRKSNCSYNISDFYPDGYNYYYVVTSPQAPNSVGDFNYQDSKTRRQLKRRNSVNGSNNISSVTTTSTTSEDDDGINLKPMRRTWTHKLLPSCVSGT